MPSVDLTFILIASSITIAYGQVTRFTSSIPNGDPACPGESVVLTCSATGTALRWEYNNDTILLYNVDEMCGDFQSFDHTRKDFLPEGINVVTVLASAIEKSADDIINCTSILEIGSAVPTPLSEIACISTVHNSTEDSRTFPYNVFVIDEEGEFEIQMKRVLGPIYNVTWRTGSLAVEDIAYITVTVMGRVSRVVHPNETSILLQLEDSNECRVNVTVVDKCDRNHSNSRDCPREETTSTGEEATATTTTCKGVSLWLPVISLALAGCVYYIVV